MKTEPKVTVCCLTYNHEPYIRQCLDGLVMQQTDFQFEIIVHDDASTDNTQSIIGEYVEHYPGLFVPVFQSENQFSKGIRTILAAYCYPLAKGEYIAFCEGDDWWTDPLKLQKQVDFLEANPDFGLCYTKVHRFSQARRQIIGEWGGNSETFEQQIRGNVIPTLSVLLRRHLVEEYQREVQPQVRGWKMGDYPMWLYVAAKSKVKFIPCVTGTYRILEHSVSHNTSYVRQLEFERSAVEIRNWFLEHYGHDIPRSTHLNQRLRLLKFEVQIAVLNGDDKALSDSVSALKALPWRELGTGRRLKTLSIMLCPRSATRIKRLAATLKRKK